MTHITFNPVPMNQLQTDAPVSVAWLWRGFLARGNLTLLTSQWKAGKTTLLAGLLRRFAEGGEFLGERCEPARVVVLSEESNEIWCDRQLAAPIGPHTRLLARPFLTRPTPEMWRALIDQAIEWRLAGELDVFVVDPLASFLPGRSESDPGTLLEMLQPLQKLASTGVAILILHHPRKERSEEGSTARGSGALLGFVDIILELHNCGRLRSEECRRRIIGLSRHHDSPSELFYHWNSATGEFTHIADLTSQRYLDNWQIVHALLIGRETAATHQELLMDWPADMPKPGATLLYSWLNRAVENKLVRREGSGVRSNPYRYRLPNEDDSYHDRNELPPLRPLFR